MIYSRKIDEKRVMRAQYVQITENEATRLKLEVPAIGTSGLVKYKGLTIGYANDFSGICIENKDFTMEHIKDILWYVNENLKGCL